jgi:hypothetical protein
MLGNFFPPFISQPLLHNLCYFLFYIFFDKGESVCFYVQLYGIDCYACGLTRATMLFIHFGFQEAWDFNKLSFIVVPMLAVLWVKSIYDDIQGKRMPGILGKLTYERGA